MNPTPSPTLQRYIREAAKNEQRWGLRAANYRKLTDEGVRSILDSSALSLKHQWTLPGTGGKPAYIGNPPDWHASFSEDDQSTRSLNRMLWWIDLQRAYWLTQDPAYAQLIIGQMLDWIRRCPPPVSNGMDSMADQPMAWDNLEIGLRLMKSWALVVDSFLGSPWLTGEEAELVITSMAAQARRLHELSPLLWPQANHNHYLTEMVGLLTVACQFHELPEAAEWRAFAVRELERCARNQFSTYGGQVEGCPHYHNVCLVQIAQPLKLAKQWGSTLGFTFSAEFHEAARRATHYSLHATRPTGTGVPWGDSDSDHHPLSAAAQWCVATQDPEPLLQLRPLAGETVWRRHVADLAWETDELPAPIPALAPPRLYWDQELKQVMMRTAWTRDALSVFFACRTPVNNGHAHIDPAAFDFTALGQALLVDPGRYCYREDEDRRAFKSPEYHNTLTINAEPPFEYLSLWEFTPQQPSGIPWAVDEPQLMATEGWHDNYLPTRHRRVVALVDNAALLVIDLLEDLPAGATVERYFHFNTVALTAQASQTWIAQFGEVGLVAADSASSTFDILSGRVSDICDQFTPSSRLRLSCPGEESARARAYATFFVPYRTPSKPAQLVPPRIEWVAEELSINCNIDETVYRLVWKPGSSLLLSSIS